MSSTTTNGSDVFSLHFLKLTTKSSADFQSKVQVARETYRSTVNLFTPEPVSLDVNHSGMSEPKASDNLETYFSIRNPDVKENSSKQPLNKIAQAETPSTSNKLNTSSISKFHTNNSAKSPKGNRKFWLLYYGYFYGIHYPILPRSTKTPPRWTHLHSYSYILTS